jgi:hypothetical protein
MSGVFQNIDPPTPNRPASVCGGRTHSLGGEGGGVNFGRRQTLLCTLHTVRKYFVLFYVYVAKNISTVNFCLLYSVFRIRIHVGIAPSGIQ